MKHSESIAKLAAALAKAFPQIGGAHKSAENPYFKSSYANLESVIDAVKEPLASNGLSVLQLVDCTEAGENVLETTILHESGEYISSRMKVVCAKQNDPQALGSAISYARRYSLQSALFVPAVDDDAESAMQRQEPAKRQPAPRQSAPKPSAPEPEETKTSFSGKHHKQLFETLIELGYTDEEFMDACKKDGLIPENAKSFFSMSDSTAEKFLKGDYKGAIRETIEKHGNKM